MRYEISELDIFSVGKVVAAVYAAGGLVMWLFVPLFLVVPMNGSEGFFARGFILLFFLGAPLINAVFGFVMGLLAGLVYNIMARSIGGLRITLRQET